MGDEVIFDAHTPGGYTLNGHSTNATSLDKIEEGDWDFVVLQEQSQLPSFPIGQVETETFPFAEDLNDHIELHNPCAETMFYMTWGRENGDASNCEFWPPVCTYAGMDSLLYLRYMMMAEMNDAVVSPVGRVWKKIRAEHPEIDLYAGDGSHPSAAGSYAAACSFYTAIFRKDPTLLTYDFSVDAEVAQTIRQVASEVVFQNLTEWYIGTYDLALDYSIVENTETEFVFSGLSANATGQEWVINGDSFEETEVTYNFEEEGTYDISYTAFNECESQDTTFQVTISVNGLSSVETEQITALYPNPVSDHLSFDIPEMGPVDLRVFDVNGNWSIKSKKVNSTISMCKPLNEVCTIWRLSLKPKGIRASS